VTDTGRSGRPGLSHLEALAREVPPTSCLIANVIEAGTLGTIAGLPEAHKSHVACEIAHKVAAGGRLFDRFPVERVGPVGYWWQDDSEQNELRRMQEYAQRHEYTGPLQLRWYFNQGLRLPDELPLLRDEIEREQQVLVLLDSLYNFLPGIDLKDESVAVILAMIKTEICDATGAAVAFVDHAAWPTDANRGQPRGYGSVFKAAVIRWGLYLDRDGGGLHIEARGNNIAGLKRTVAVWDEDQLELRTLEPQVPGERDLRAEVLDHLRSHHPAWRTSTEVTNKKTHGGIGVRRKDVVPILDALVASGAAETRPAPEGKGKDAVGFRAVVSTMGQAGTTAAGGHTDSLSADPLSPRRGEGSGQADASLVPDARTTTAETDAGSEAER